MESRQFNDNSQVNSAGIFSGNPITNATYPPSPEPPGTTVPPLPPITEENIVYVPNTLEGQITLSNFEYLEEYSDHNSPIYQSLASDLERDIKESLFPGFPSDEINVKVMSMK